jgi:hypothetical protein
MSSRAALYGGGGRLLERAQRAHVLRADMGLTEVIRMVGGIAKIPSSDSGQIDHILGVAFDGLCYREPGA